MKYILIGRGKMGKLIRETASAAGDEIQAAFGMMIWTSWAGWAKWPTW